MLSSCLSPASASTRSFLGLHNDGHNTDHPVDGVILRGRYVYIYVHRDVKGISGHSDKSRIIRYTIPKDKLWDFTQKQKQKLHEEVGFCHVMNISKTKEKETEKEKKSKKEKVPRSFNASTLDTAHFSAVAAEAQHVTISPSASCSAPVPVPVRLTAEDGAYIELLKLSKASTVGTTGAKIPTKHHMIVLVNSHLAGGTTICEWARANGEATSNLAHCNNHRTVHHALKNVESVVSSSHSTAMSN